MNRTVPWGQRYSAFQNMPVAATSVLRIVAVGQPCHCKLVWYALLYIIMIVKLQLARHAEFADSV